MPPQSENSDARRPSEIEPLIEKEKSMSLSEVSASEKFGSFVNKGMQFVFGWLGETCAKRPWTVILLSLLVLALTTSGVYFFEFENREELLWVPKGSVVLEHFGFYSAMFAPEPRDNKLLLIAPSETTNVLEKPLLLSALSLHEQILSLETFEEEQYWNFDSLCLRNLQEECEVDSVLSLWNFNSSLLENDPSPLETINSQIPKEKIDLWLGGIKYSPENSQILSASAFKFVYRLENRARLEGGSYVDPPAFAWEGEFLDLVLADPSPNPDFLFHPDAERSFQDEFGGAVDGDLNFLMVSFTLIMIYLCIVLGEFTLLRSRVLLACSGILSIGFAVATSFGISSLCGFKYNYVHSVMPFLLLAVGVDNIFIIVNSFQDTNFLHELPDRAREAMSHAGVSITVTSLTNFTAFIIGTTTSLPALTSFCFYTAIAILFLYLYQITFFCACVALDEKRIENTRADCCFCSVNSQEDLTLPGKKRALFTKFMERVWGRFLMLLPVKIISVLVALGLLGFAINGILRLEIQDALTNFIPKSSYVTETRLVEADYFQKTGTLVEIVTQPMDDYFLHQDGLASVGPIIEKDPYMQSSDSVFYRSWYESFLLWLSESSYKDLLDENGRPPNRQYFYSWLNEYLEGEGKEFKEDVVFAENSTQFILATRIYSSYIVLPDAIDEVRAMKSLRKTTHEIEVSSYPWTFEYLTWEQNAVVSEEIYLNLALSFAAIFIISFVLIANPLASIFVLLSVVMTIVDIIGIMYYWGLSLDSVTAVNLVLAVGFSVDYTAHIAHCFMLKKGTREERVIKTLGTIGISVFNGAFSTFLAILVLSFSTSYVFVVFFKQFFLVCILGVFHGMVLLPIVLSWIGPAPYARREDFV